ncbi:hypothetical protein BWK58_02665 [Flavobacterium columnare]|nr:hypothetical protein BWK58_02665 [Flavobacterium columnare]
MVKNIRDLLRDNFFKDSFFILLSNFFVKGVGFFVGFLLARMIGSDAFGQFNSIKNNFFSIAAFATFGLGFVSTRYTSENKNRIPIFIIFKKIFIFPFCLSIFFFLAIIGNAKFVAINFFNLHSLQNEIQLLGLIVVLIVVTNIQNGIISGYQYFKILSFYNILVGFLNLIFTYFLTLYFSLLGACFSLLFIQLVNVIINFFIMKKINNEFDVKFNSKIYNVNLFKESLPIALLDLVFLMTLLINSYILQNFSTYEKLGIYSASMQWYMMLIFIPTVLKNVVLSHFSIDGEGALSKNKEILKKSMAFTLCFTFFLSVFPFLFLNKIVLLYGNSYVGIEEILPWIVITSFFANVNIILEQFLISKYHSWSVFFFAIIRDLGTTLSLLYFSYTVILNDLIIGLVISYMIMNIFVCILLIYKVRKIL